MLLTQSFFEALSLSSDKSDMCKAHSVDPRRGTSYGSIMSEKRALKERYESSPRATEKARREVDLSDLKYRNESENLLAIHTILT